MRHHDRGVKYVRILHSRLFYWLFLGSKQDPLASKGIFAVLGFDQGLVKMMEYLLEEGVFTTSTEVTGLVIISQDERFENSGQPIGPCAMRLTSLTIAILSASAYASSGDRSPYFIDCVDLCKVTRCGPHFWSSSSWALRVTRWSCTDDCKYECMHKITDMEIQQGRNIQQYHGKWPFWRVAGMQEPASVAFSLLNLWAHARGTSKIRKKVLESHPMRPYYLVWSIISINAWIWSSIFHTRGDWHILSIF